MTPRYGGGAPPAGSADHHHHHHQSTTGHHPGGICDASTSGRRSVLSQQVWWWSVHQWVAERLADLDWPMAGTPEWCELDDTDPRKVAALFDGAQHWSLRVETCQQQLAEASRDVSEGADWSSIADEMRRRRKVYVPRAVA